ncbi:TetR/AcrR family transcriptional regulator [Amycolatopsis acidiphila]|uniref:TetR/AcrR family transcriptional regulator n=1 Tax=Amycolatopsis acidiphila TaxID=715473 RepID=A0A558AG25_9PSEU|nr:TetR family transcriptional regulator [Amycolatopsis acidiphila]TVT23176.1 TetR/AcrR family transcriptional regulator [Amycolatopsis acidiphila]UIJ64161.1 TetR/AcrR family transcriptional regulator [Amycolatopsis acidiphila]GHG60779.1 TetR family transcriptional regulator [Amycolatopsis acidiphila]
MSPEERRKMIVRAVLPLIVEHGAAVTTAQIARTAGIGEGTIFRAFKDKDELVEACVFEALRPDGMLELIAEIPLDQPLAQRLTEAADVLSAHLERIGAIAGAMQTSGMRRRGKPGDRQASFVAMRTAVAELFEPERGKLRLSPEKLARIFLSLLLSRARDDQHALDVGELVDVFLHGAVTAR